MGCLNSVLPKDTDVRHTFLLALVMFSGVAWAANCPTNQAKDGAALVQLEQTWAKALEHHDAEAVGLFVGQFHRATWREGGSVAGQRL